MKYKSGDTQKILSISRETLRFFEEKGLITPVRDKNNNYRYYDTLDLNKIVAYKFYRSLEFSLEEAIEMVDLGNESQIERLFLQTEYLEKKAKYYLELSSYIKNYNNHYKEILKLLNNPIVEVCEDTILYFNQKKDIFEMNGESSKDTQIWLENFPYIKIAVNIIFSKKDCECETFFGYGITKEYSDIFEKLKTNSTKQYKKTKCIHGLISFENDELRYSDFEFLIIEAEKKGFKCSEEFYGWLLNEENLDNKKIRYLECYIPLE